MLNTATALEYLKKTFKGKDLDALIVALGEKSYGKLETKHEKLAKGLSGIDGMKGGDILWVLQHIANSTVPKNMATKDLERTKEKMLERLKEVLNNGGPKEAPRKPTLNAPAVPAVEVLGPRSNAEMQKLQQARGAL